MMLVVSWSLGRIAALLVGVCWLQLVQLVRTDLQFDSV